MRTFFIAWVLMTTAFCFVSGVESPRPNFLIIMSDDMGYADVGCYGGTAETPRIDRLANEGMRFTDFYCGAPNCSPSRGNADGAHPFSLWRVRLGSAQSTDVSADF